MAFFEERFPDCLSFGAIGGPSFSTSVAWTTNGYRTSNRKFLYPLHEYEVAQNVKTEEDFETVRSFFLNVYGQFDGFRFKDWADYKVVGTQGIIIDVSGVKHLGRRYSFGARSFDRLISKPVVGTVTITGGGTLDYTTGIITGGSPTSWVGEFDVPAVFTTDLLSAAIVNRSGDGQFFMSWSSVPIKEFRV